jgi:hypothetical protein
LASATVGFDDSGTATKGESGGGRLHSAVALELPSWVGDDCGQDAYNSFEELRDAVAEVVDLFGKRSNLIREKINLMEVIIITAIARFYQMRIISNIFMCTPNHGTMWGSEAWGNVKRCNGMERIVCKVMMQLR